MVRTDTYGAYIWNASAVAPNGTTGTWQQLVNSNSMPSAFVSTVGVVSYHNGVSEIQIAPNNSSVIYMIYNTITGSFPSNQGVYKSTDKGVTWALTKFTPVDFKSDLGGDSAGGNTAVKVWGPKLAVDPTDPTIVYVGTGNNGLWKTTDGGSTWSRLANIPTATSRGGVYPGYSGVVVSPVNHLIVYAYSYGNGVYKSADGGLHWTRVTSGTPPSIIQTAQIDPNTGYYWASAGDGNIYKFDGSTWTEPYTGGAARDVAIDPRVANHIVIADGNDQLAESTNGTSFGSFSRASGSPSTSGDIGWMALFNGVNCSSIRYALSGAKKVYCASNRNFWNVSWTGSLASATLTWNSQGRGVENLTTARIIVPNTGAPVLGTWDTAIFKPNSTKYPIAPYPNVVQLYGGWSLDYATSDSNFIVALIDDSFYGQTHKNLSASSNDGGNTWTPLPSVPSNAWPNGGQAGCVAVSTSSNFIYAPGGGVQPSYTTDGGNTWKRITISGIASWAAFTQCSFFGGQLVAADRSITNTFYLFFPGKGFYKSTDGGNGWISIATVTATYFLGSGAQIKATPGTAGDFWFSAAGSAGAGQYDKGEGGPCLWHYNGSRLI